MSPAGILIRREGSPQWVMTPLTLINVKNFHESLTTVVRAQNDTSKTANITYTIFDRTLNNSPYKRRRFENRSDQTFCILLIKDVLSVIESANLRRRQNLKQNDPYSNSDFRINLDPDVRRISVPNSWIHSSTSFISPSLVQIGC